MEQDREFIELVGTVSSTIFQNTDNGYAVLRLDTKGGAATAAGVMPGVSPGERLRLTGLWTTHSSYGEQFKVEVFEHILPDTAEEIYKYLASGAIKNVGPATARRLVDAFGGDTLFIMENDPEKLADVKGITLKTAHKISESYRGQASLRRLIDVLSVHGIKPLVATRVFKDYADLSLDAVNTNPYLLAGEPYGAAFSQTDAMAIALGFESDCAERISAALLFELTHNLQNGHVFVPSEKLVDATCRLISISREPAFETLYMLDETGDIVNEEIAGVEVCYLASMHEAETYVAKRILQLAKTGCTDSVPDELITEIEARQDIKYAKTQREALVLASRYPVIAMTGGPGTGKTTTVRGILSLFDSLGLKTVLCAPTGRAAKRLSETCRRDATTIHRLLGTTISGDSSSIFEHDEDNPIDADAVIVDESSMIDIILMRALLSAMNEDCRIVMVGDADQLPPVGPGCVFSDILRSEVVPKVVLSEIFRQAGDSGIVKNAHAINQGIMPNLREKHPDFFFIKRTKDEDISETVAGLFAERLPRNMNIDPTRIQVLTPTRRRAAGTVSLNTRLREAVNPKSVLKREKSYGDFVFRIGDKVMQTKNNYDIMWKSLNGAPDGAGVFNGDIGVISDIDISQETVIVEYEDKSVTYLFEQLSELEPAFAMTVHKSQGSEYHAVILALADGAPGLLTRGILYTAMTRARKLLILVGDPFVMEKMVNNDRRQRRYTGLRVRLCDGFNTVL